MTLSLPSAARGDRLPRPLASVARSTVLAAATAAALAVLALAVAPPQSAAEARFLALWAGGVLLAAGVGGAAVTPVAALFAVAAGWLLPPGTARGAVIGLLLVLALADAVARATRREIEATSLFALAVGAQILFQPQLLLAPAAGALLLSLVALPALAALATWLLAERYGARAWVAAGAALAVGAGWRLDTTLALLALAGGARLGDARRSRLERAAGAVAVLLPLAVQMRGGALAAGAGACLALPAWAPAIGAAAVGAALLLRLRDAAGALALLALAGMLVPFLPWGERGKLRTLLAGALLALAAALGAPEPTALAGPLGLLAGEVALAALPFQGAWSGLLVGGAALLATYPWLRAAPLITLAESCGVWHAGRAGAATIVLLLAAGAAAAWLGRRAALPADRRRVAFAGFGVLVLLVVLGPLAGGGRHLLEQEFLLDAAHPVWQTAHTGSVREVVVDSTLGNAADLPPGTPVAVLRLRDAGGVLYDYTLRAGEDTAEWAAGRPDLARRAIAAPQPWASWVAGNFFGRRYRTRWRLAQPVATTAIALARDPTLPPATTMTLLQVSVR